MRWPKGVLPANHLIDVVRACPELWDTGHPDFCRSAVAKECKWREIAALMELPVHQIKSRWKNLRDCYAKHLRAQADEEALPGRYRTYAWSKQMRFIAPFLSVRLGGVPLRAGAVAELLGADPGDPGDAASRGPAAGGGLEAFRKEKREAARRLRRRRVGSKRPPPAPAAPTASSRPSSGEPSYRGLRDLNANELIFHGYAKIVNQFAPLRQLETRRRILKVLEEQEAAHLAEARSAREEEEEGEEEEEVDERRLTRRRVWRRETDTLVTKQEPPDDDDDSQYFDNVEKLI